MKKIKSAPIKKSVGDKSEGAKKPRLKPAPKAKNWKNSLFADDDEDLFMNTGDEENFDDFGTDESSDDGDQY